MISGGPSNTSIIRCSTWTTDKLITNTVAEHNAIKVNEEAKMLASLVTDINIDDTSYIIFFDLANSAEPTMHSNPFILTPLHWDYDECEIHWDSSDSDYIFISAPLNANNLQMFKLRIDSGTVSKIEFSELEQPHATLFVTSSRFCKFINSDFKDIVTILNIYFIKFYFSFDT